jgi:hypothetical protein
LTNRARLSFQIENTTRPIDVRKAEGSGFTSILDPDFTQGCNLKTGIFLKMDKKTIVAKENSFGDTQFLLPLLLGFVAVLLFVDNSRTNEELSSISGYISGMLFIIANAYYPARLIAREFRPIPKSVVLFFQKYLVMHIWMNEVAFFAMIVHCHYSDQGNIFLTGLYVVSIFLTLEGLVMHYRLIPGEQKLLRLMHTQQVLFVVWILLIIVGHAID